MPPPQKTARRPHGTETRRKILMAKTMKLNYFVFP
jgi:hypothetical protein